MSKTDDISEAGSSPSPDTAETVNSKKRKTNLEEIEVDINLPEPPSKKARRALKKGKPIPTKSAGADKKNDDDDAKEDKTKARSEHGVWIGNLPFDVSPTELRRWLVANSGGVILEESITRLKMPLNNDRMRLRPMGEVEKPVNKGFAYVDFDGIGPQMAAIALSEEVLGSRKLLIKNSTSFEGRPKPVKAEEGEEGEGEQPAEQKKARNVNQKVFVGNLGFDTSEDDLWAHFEKCGGIDWVKIATFEDSGKCKGYGWIRFKTPEAAAWAAKGFVKIKELIETEEDFQDGVKEEDSEEKEKEKKYKTRKWWVNRLRGRELKIEMAEDDQSRYKKRFKKDGKGGKGRPKKEAAGADEYVQDAVKSAMAAESAAA